MKNRITPEVVETLEPNQIFVFGSNKKGRHGAGAALTAVRKFGAKEGVGEGLTGQSYAFPTIEKLRPYTRVTLDSFQHSVYKLGKCMEEHPELEFLITPLGLGLAGFKVETVAPMLVPLIKFKNATFPKVVVDYWRMMVSFHEFMN